MRRLTTVKLSPYHALGILYRDLPRTLCQENHERDYQEHESHQHYFCKDSANLLSNEIRLDENYIREARKYADHNDQTYSVADTAFRDELSEPHDHYRSRDQR